MGVERSLHPWMPKMMCWKIMHLRLQILGYFWYLAVIFWRNPHGFPTVLWGVGCTLVCWRIYKAAKKCKNWGEINSIEKVQWVKNISALKHSLKKSFHTMMQHAMHKNMLKYLPRLEHAHTHTLFPCTLENCKRTGALKTKQLQFNKLYEMIGSSQIGSKPDHPYWKFIFNKLYDMTSIQQLHLHPKLDHPKVILFSHLHPFQSLAGTSVWPGDTSSNNV